MDFNYKTALRNFIFISIILIGNLNSFSQSYINFDGAMVFATFKFTTQNNSDNVTTPTAYSPITTNSFSLGYKHQLSNGLFILGAAELKKGGATLVYNRVNYAWNLQYTGLRAGIGYQYDKFKVRPYAAALPYFSYLLNAQQSIGVDVYDLKANNNIKKSDFGFYLVPGINIEVARSISIYVEYNYVLGLRNIETSSSQYLYNRASAFRLGVTLNLTPPPRVYDTVMSGDGNVIASTQTAQTNLANQPTSGFTTEKNSSNNSSNSEGINPNTKNAITNSDSAASNLSYKISNNNKTTDTTSSTTYSGTTNKSNYNNSAPDSSKKQAVENTGQQFIAGNYSNSSSGNSLQKNGSDVNNSLISNSTTGTEQKNTQPYTNQNTPKTDKLTDSQLKNISKIASNKDIIFKIQISAVKNEASNAHFSNKNITGAIRKEKGSDGFTRYYVGTFKTYEKAKEELDKMKANGASTDGFIVAFKDAKKITVSDAVKLLK